MRHCMGIGLTYIPFTCYFIFSPLEKGFMVHMKKNKHLHLPSLVEIGPVVLVEKTNMKSLWTGRQQVIRKAHLTFHLG